MGRPKNPNRPPTVTAVRLTEKTRKKLKEEHDRWNSNEPLDRTISRALDELISLRKKVKGLSSENLGLAEEIRQHIDDKKQLLKIQHKQAEQISKYENGKELLNWQEANK